MSKYKFNNYGDKANSKRKKSKNKKKVQYNKSSDIVETLNDIGRNFKKLYRDCRACFARKMVSGNFPKGRLKNINTDILVIAVVIMIFVIIGLLTTFPLAIVIFIIGGVLYLHR